MAFQYNFKLAGVGVILIFWTILGFGHYPAPWCDDAFFIGAAVNLAQHNVFSNPWCEALSDYGSTSYFFSALPLHSYVLAVWLKIFGVNAFSFHLFSTLVALGATLGIYRLFPGSSLSWIYALFISLAVYGLLGGAGLRMDGLALFLLALGMGVYQARGLGAFFGGNLLLALVVITLPSLGLIALLVSGSVFLHRCLSAKKKSEVWPLFWAMAAAYGLVFLVFLWFIDARLAEFLAGLRKDRDVASAGIIRRFQFFTSLGLAKWIAAEGSFVLLLGVLALLWRKDPARQTSRFFLGVTAIGYLLLAFSSINSALAPHIWAFACLMIALWLPARENWGLRALIPWTAVFIIASYGHSHVVIQDCLADPPLDPHQREHILAQLDQIHSKRIYVDTYALREIYDYRLPDNVHSYEWSAPIRKGPASDHTVAIVSAAYGLNQDIGDASPEKPKPIYLFGHGFRGVFKNPYDLVLIENRF